MSNDSKISFFDKYLTVWVIICMVIGIIISQYFPFVIEFLSKFEYAQISIPMAILIWIMIYPMMLKIDFNSIKRVKDNLRAIVLTWCVNWLIQPFDKEEGKLVTRDNISNDNDGRFGNTIFNRCSTTWNRALYGNGICMERTD